MSYLKLCISILLINIGSMFNSFIAYRCVVTGHEGFAIAFLVFAWTSFVIFRGNFNETKRKDSEPAKAD